MRRTIPDRATRFPSSRELEAAEQEYVAPPRACQDDDGGPTSGWPRQSVSSSAFSRSTEDPSSTGAPRHRMAWMLAHAPEFSHLDQPDATERTDLRRLRLDSPVDQNSTGGPTESGRCQHIEPFQPPRDLARSRYMPNTPIDQAPFTPPPYSYVAAAHSTRRHSNQEEEMEPRYFSERSRDAYSNRKEDTKSRVYPNTETPGDGESDIDVDVDIKIPGEDTETKAEPNVPKTSRYLREMDRRVILDRLAQGEKQAPLAKEFNVSRAAISNLYKHRHEILARSDENPFAKHPKTKKKPTTKTRQQQQRARARSESAGSITSKSVRSVGESTASTPQQTPSPHPTIESSPSPGTLLIARSRALPFLLSAMSDSTRSLQDFRRITERALWLLLEEALAAVAVEVPSGFDQSFKLENVVTNFPPCAISMEKDSLEVTPLLNIFQLIEPHQPFGIARVSTHRDALTVEIADAGLPHSLRGYNAFVLDVVAASGEAVCVTIERLLRQFDVAEASVMVVSLFASSEVVAMVQCKHPLVKIVTARIDSSITRRRIASTPVDLILHRMRNAYRELP